MAGVRIKDLQDAKGVVETFDDFHFAVDSSNPDTTMKLSGRLRSAHQGIHPIRGGRWTTGGA